MQHFPIYLDLIGKTVVVAGDGDFALAKLRLLSRTEARLVLVSAAPGPELAEWLSGSNVIHIERGFRPDDVDGAALVYAAHGDAERDAHVQSTARRAGVLCNVVDNLEASDFITPAIVDRAPVTVAIGTEGAAPVLARRIKADVEAMLAPSLGILARAGKLFRKKAEALPQGRARREFWAEYYDSVGPEVLAAVGEGLLDHALSDLLAQHQSEADKPGHVDFVGAGPGDPELLTLKARKVLDRADVVIYDRLVPDVILDLARREALFLPVGKEGFGPSTSQEAINDLLVRHALQGAHVVRLKGGDATVFARLDEESHALDAAGVSWSVNPGVTAASAAAAAVGRSLTQRGRNSSVRFITAHDVRGYAEHDWRDLAQPGAVTVVYMGRRAARFVQGRLLMHGCPVQTPVALVENASRPAQRIVSSTLGQMAADLRAMDTSGPVVLMIGMDAAKSPVAHLIKSEARIQ